MTAAVAEAEIGRVLLAGPGPCGGRFCRVATELAARTHTTLFPSPSAEPARAAMSPAVGVGVAEGAGKM